MINFRKQRFELCRALAYKPVKSKYYRNYREFPVVYDMSSRIDGTFSESYEVIAGNGDTYCVDSNGFVEMYLQWKNYDSDNVLDCEGQFLEETDDGGFRLVISKNGKRRYIDTDIPEVLADKVIALDTCLDEIIDNVSSAKRKKANKILSRR